MVDPALLSPDELIQWYLHSSTCEERENLFSDNQKDNPSSHGGNGGCIGISATQRQSSECPFDQCEECGDVPGAYIVVDYGSGSYVCARCGLEKNCPLLEDRIFFEEEDKKTSAPMRNRYLQRHHFSERLNAFLCNDPELPWGLLYIIKDEIEILDPGFQTLRDETQAKELVRKAIQRLVKRKERHARSTMQEKWILIRYEITGLKPEVPPGFSERMMHKFNYFLNAWFRNKPTERKNILHLNSLLRELCGQCFGTEFMRQTFPYFPLLKNKKKVSQVECQLKAVCESLGWEYLPIT